MTPTFALRRALPCAATLLALAAAPAQAGDLFVGSGNTVFARGHAVHGGFAVAGACGGSIHSMIADGEDLFLGATHGVVYHYEAGTGVTDYLLPVSNNAAALAVRGNELFVGGSNGTVLRLDKQSGTVLGTSNLGFPVTELVSIGNHIYAGLSAGVVFRADAAVGNYSFWGTCGGPISGLTHDATHLILGTTTGSIYRIRLADQVVDGTFGVGGTISALVLHGGQLLVADGTTSVRRVNRMTGAPVKTLDWDFAVDAMTLNAFEPGNPYCYGFSCPCGNDDASAGCRNSLGAGAMVTGQGSTSVSSDDLVLTVTGLPTNSSGRFYMGAGLTNVPFGDGLLCAGSGGYGQFRFPGTLAGNAGTFTLGPGLVSHAAAHFGPTGQMTPGFTWHFQVWYRNLVGPCGSGFNTSTAYSVTFAP